MKKRSKVKATLISFEDKEAREACKPCLEAQKALIELRLEGELSEVKEEHEDVRIAPTIRLESDCVCTEIQGFTSKKDLKKEIEKLRWCDL